MWCSTQSVWLIQTSNDAAAIRGLNALPGDLNWCPTRPFTDSDFLDWLMHHARADLHLEAGRMPHPYRLALARAYWQLRKAERSTPAQRKRSFLAPAGSITGGALTSWFLSKIKVDLPLPGIVELFLVVLAIGLGAAVGVVVGLFAFEQKSSQVRDEIETALNRLGLERYL